MRRFESVCIEFFSGGKAGMMAMAAPQMLVAAVLVLPLGALLVWYFAVQRRLYRTQVSADGKAFVLSIEMVTARIISFLLLFPLFPGVADTELGINFPLLIAVLILIMLAVPLAVDFSCFFWASVQQGLAYGNAVGAAWKRVIAGTKSIGGLCFLLIFCTMIIGAVSPDGTQKSYADIRSWQRPAMLEDGIDHSVPRCTADLARSKALLATAKALAASSRDHGPSMACFLMNQAREAEATAADMTERCMLRRDKDESVQALRKSLAERENWLASGCL